MLINQVGLPAAVTTWQKALTDTQNPTINPAGVMTGEFLKGYVTTALHANGKQRRSGTPRPRPVDRDQRRGAGVRARPPPRWARRPPRRPRRSRRRAGPVQPRPRTPIAGSASGPAARSTCGSTRRAASLPPTCSRRSAPTN